MTTIAYRDGVIAGDTRLWCGDSFVGCTIKVCRSSSGRLAGCSGEAGWMRQFLQAVESGSLIPWPPKDEARGFIVYEDGTIEDYAHTGPSIVAADYYAIGSGSPEALGAMFAGADAETAVRAASHHDAHTGGEITVLRR